MAADNKQSIESSYAFYGSDGSGDRRASRDAALRLGEKRLHPSLQDLDYLVLRSRISTLTGWIDSLPDKPLTVLDVGGRIQPYRALFRNLERYVAIDLVPEGLVDVIADAQVIPISDDSCDAVICTQVLSYISEPGRVISESFRVLKPGGTLLLTIPAFFPQHHDEKWRFTRTGIESLLENFETQEVVPECFSIAGLARSFNYLLHSDIENYRISRLVSFSTIPTINWLGRILDKLIRGNEMCTANYCARAVKPS